VSIFLLALILGIALLESVSYIGYIQAHFFIPSALIYLSGILIFFLPIRKHFHFNKSVNIMLTLTAITSSVLYFSLNLIESAMYENYIFSLLHINLRGLEIFTALSIIIFFIARSHSRGLSQSLRAGLIGSLVFVFISNITHLTPIIVKAISPVITNPMATYEKKLTKAHPIYPVMQLITKLTPEDATIIIPPQGAPWVSEGNDALVLRFLYPRRVVHLEDLASIYQDNTYLLIAKGTWPSDGTYEHGWPKMPVEASRVWKFDLTSHSSTEFARSYDPSLDLWDWGLIEVKHD
jgi:hypothetical protein